jgi:hypothetical protein
MLSGAEGQEGLRKVGKPIRRGTAGFEGVFEGAVKTFNHAIGLRMKSRGFEVFEVQKGANLGPKGRGELGAPVSGDCGRDAKTGNPKGTESLSARGCRGGGEGGNLRPTGCAVNHGEEVSVALGGGQGSNDVKVNVGKTAGGDGNLVWGWGDVGVDFGFLAREALSGPEVDIFSHTLP